MTNQGSLEIKGSLLEHPFAELLVEAFSHNLDGSFRLSNGEQKVIIYIKTGQVVFAVSNVRRYRLFENLLQTGKISNKLLSEIPNFANDIEFGEVLVAKSIVSKTEIDEIFVRLIAEILASVFEWQTGEWFFNPLARVRETIEYKTDTIKLRINYASALSAAQIAEKLKNHDETFAPAEFDKIAFSPSPTEAFILSRFENQPLQIKDLLNSSGLPETETLKNLYALWMGNLLIRQSKNPAFSENWISAIKSAKLSLRKEEIQPPKIAAAPLPEKPAETSVEEILPAKVDDEVSLKEYLARVETAQNYYEMMQIPVNATTADVKTAYFKVAKNFHPDRFHHDTDTIQQQRVQHAFSEVARAYETLKNPETRQNYDYKLGKSEPIQAPAQSAAQESAQQNPQTGEQSRDNFEQGFSLLMNKDYAQALPFMARAVHLNPGNARYHAYYGKVLSMEDKQRYKGEAELQMAIKIEPNNPAYRIMAAEFYTQFGLLKRAEGELRRLLAIVPDNKEARAMLDSLPKK